MSTAASRPRSEPPPRIVVMGVAGSGKTTIAARLAARLVVPLLEGDALHPSTNIAKMSAGIALADDDRWPWLDRIAAEMAAHARVVCACSALRRAYRDRLRAAGPLAFVYLAGTPALIEARMAARTGHFMPTSLVASQFAALEPPGSDEAAVTVDIDAPEAGIVDAILRSWE